MHIKDGRLYIDDKDIDKLITYKLKQLDEILEVCYDDILEKKFDVESVRVFPLWRFEKKKQENPEYTKHEYEIDCTEEYFKEYLMDLLNSRLHPSIMECIIQFQKENLKLFTDKMHLDSDQLRLLSALRGIDKYAKDKINCLEEDILFNKGINPRIHHCLKALDAERTRYILTLQRKSTKWQELFEIIAQNKYMRGASINSIEQNRKCLETIFEILGKRYVEDITYSDCHRISDCIYNLPKQWRRESISKRLNIRQLLRRRDISKISYTNAKKYLWHFKEFLSFAKKRRYIIESLDEDIDIPKGREPVIVDGFSKEELKLIFNPKTYPHKNDKEQEHHFWIPLIALYSGMRLNEICQLYIEDIKCKNNIWYFDLKVERPDHHIKNEQSKRFVPVHPKLIELGFMEYVQLMHQLNEKQLFPQLVYNEKKYFRGPISSWFSRYLSKIGIEGRNKVFHSIRHTVKPRLRDAGIQQEYQNAICGWAAQDIGERVYGGQIPVERLYKELSKLDYPFLHKYFKEYDKSSNI